MPFHHFLVGFACGVAVGMILGIVIASIGFYWHSGVGKPYSDGVSGEPGMTEGGMTNGGS